MPFITSTETLSSAWEDAQAIARAVKTTAEFQKSNSLAGPVAGSAILSFEAYLRTQATRLDVIAALPGIAGYVATLANTPEGYNVATEFGAMRTQMDATVTWIRTNFPKDANGYLLERQFAGGGYVERTFSTVQLANYRTQLDALIAALG